MLASGPMALMMELMTTCKPERRKEIEREETNLLTASEAAAQPGSAWARGKKIRNNIRPSCRVDFAYLIFVLPLGLRGGEMFFFAGKEAVRQGTHCI